MKPPGKRFHILAAIACAILLSNLGLGRSGKDSATYHDQLSINLKARALVIGPTIRLRDLGKIVVPDSVKRARVADLKIADAPPPGESSEISLNYIKRRLHAAGFHEFTSSIKGPSIIRVTTAQDEIDKAMIKDEYASLSAEPSVYSVRELKIG
jgi:hypothetical protein